MSFSSNSQTSRIYGQESVRADHGRADWLGCWDEFVQKARFKKLVCLHHIKQNYLIIWDVFECFVYLCLPGSTVYQSFLKINTSFAFTNNMKGLH